MAIADGSVVLAADVGAMLGLIAPVEVVLDVSRTPGTSQDDVLMADNSTPLGITKTVGGTSEIYEVTLHAACSKTSATDSTLQVRLVVDGVTWPSTIVMRSASANDRRPGSFTWLVTGLAAGSREFKVQATQSASDKWSIVTPHTKIIVKRVG